MQDVCRACVILQRRSFPRRHEARGGRTSVGSGIASTVTFTNLVALLRGKLVSPKLGTKEDVMLIGGTKEHHLSCPRSRQVCLEMLDRERDETMRPAYC